MWTLPSAPPAYVNIFGRTLLRISGVLAGPVCGLKGLLRRFLRRWQDGLYETCGSVPQELYEKNCTYSAKETYNLKEPTNRKNFSLRIVREDFLSLHLQARFCKLYPVDFVGCN